MSPRRLSGMAVLGYNCQIVSVSSAHVGGDGNPHASQWRDRLYFVYLDDFCSGLSDSRLNRAAVTGESGPILGRVAASQWPEDGLDLAVSGAVFSQAFLQRGGVVPGVAEVGVGTVGEQPPDAGWPAVARRGVQGQAPPFGIGFVDRGSCLNELIDDLQPLVVGREDQRADPALDGE